MTIFRKKVKCDTFLVQIMFITVPRWKFKWKFEKSRKFHILSNWHQKWSFMTVYTLCLDDNFSKEGQMDYIFGPKMISYSAKLKIQKKLEAFRKFRSFQNWHQKWSFSQSIHCISMTIFRKMDRMDYIFWSEKVHNSALNENSKKVEEFKKFHILSNWHQNDHLYSLYTVSRWQFFEKRRMDYIFEPKRFITVPMMKIQK